jgi:hypothetical protein
MPEAHASLVQLDTTDKPRMLNTNLSCSSLQGSTKQKDDAEVPGQDLTRCCTRGPRWRRSSGWRRKVTSRCIECLERHRKAARQRKAPEWQATTIKIPSTIYFSINYLENRKRWKNPYQGIFLAIVKDLFLINKYKYYGLQHSRMNEYSQIIRTHSF